MVSYPLDNSGRRTVTGKRNFRADEGCKTKRRIIRAYARSEGPSSAVLVAIQLTELAAWPWRGRHADPTTQTTGQGSNGMFSRKKPSLAKRANYIAQGSTKMWRVVSFYHVSQTFERRVTFEIQRRIRSACPSPPNIKVPVL